MGAAMKMAFYTRAGIYEGIEQLACR